MLQGRQGNPDKKSSILLRSYFRYIINLYDSFDLITQNEVQPRIRIKTHMENQFNIENQNVQQIGQNPIDPPTQILKQPKPNYWMFLAFLFAFLFIATLNRYIAMTKKPLINNKSNTNSSEIILVEKQENALSEEKMLSSEVTYDCKIRVKTDKGREFYLNTAYDTIDPNKSKCYQFLLNKISPSGNFLVYQSISGGIDSQLVVYTLNNRNNEGHNIGVFGTATIKDIGFLPGDKLVALMGIPEDFQTWGLFRLDLVKLYKDYPNNYGKDNVDMFTDIESDEKQTPLPNKNKDYNGFTIDTDKVRIDTVGPNVEFIEYNVSEL